MSREDEKVRLSHMRDAARAALAFVRDSSRGQLDADLKLQFALTRAIEIIGEASTKVSDDFKSAHPEIPWSQIKGMRNRLIHGYDRVDLDFLWSTVADDLAPLIEAIGAWIGPPPAEP
jgi:uncharacterized protein with HEPN domain